MSDARNQIARFSQFAYLVMVASAVLAFHSHAAVRSSTLKTSAKMIAPDYRLTTGIVFPGFTGSIQTRVATIKNRFPLYAGADLDIAFLWLGIGFTPMASATMYFPLKSIVTPSVGASAGVSFITGAFGHVGLTFLVRPGMVVNIDKGIDVDFQLRMGAYASFFMASPQLGMRFAL